MEFSLGSQRVQVYANGVIEGCQAENVVNHIEGAILPSLWRFFSKLDNATQWSSFRGVTAAEYEERTTVRPAR